jgi:hypothetical protein
MKRIESTCKVRRFGAIAFAGITGLFVVQVPTPAVAKQPQIRCEELVGWKLAATAIGLPTRGASVETASLSAANDPNGKYCKVNGAIHSVDASAQPIRFQINLPGDWNEKAVHAGGGGYDGTLVDALRVSFAGERDERPVAAGYATFGSDSGHQSSGFTDPAPAKFALNDEELANFGGAQLKKTHDVAREAIRRYYGASPKRVYFYGSSQGGHEGLIVAQRWPKDYDGVVAIHPAYNFTALQLSGLHVGKVLYRSPGAWLAPARCNSSLARCFEAATASTALLTGSLATLPGVDRPLTSTPSDAKAARMQARGACRMSSSQPRVRSTPGLISAWPCRAVFLPSRGGHCSRALSPAPPVRLDLAWRRRLRRRRR